MDIIRRKHLKNGRLRKGERREYIEREYKVYRRAEAAERDIQFVDWRAVEPGQWGLTDDGWVGECTDKRQYKEKDNIVFSFGQFWYTPSTKYGSCEYEPRRDSESYTMTSPKQPWETYKGKKKYKDFVKVYVSQLINGTIDYKILGKVFGDKKNHEIKARALLKKEDVNEMIDKEMLLQEMRVRDLKEISKVVMKEDFYAFINAGNNVLRSLEERGIDRGKKYLEYLVKHNIM